MTDTTSLIITIADASQINLLLTGGLPDDMEELVFDLPSQHPVPHNVSALADIPLPNGLPRAVCATWGVSPFRRW
ncbi:hypothetical protein IAR50_006567 [Cryptococcus sp. DSM 104548]